MSTTKNLQIQVSELETEIQGEFSKIDQKNSYFSILSCWCKRITICILQIDQVSKRLRQKFEAHLRKISFFNIQDPQNSVNYHKESTESTLCQSINETFQIIGIHLKSQYSNLERVWEVNEDLLRNVDNLLQNHKPSSLQYAYIANIQESSFKLREITERINWEADTVNLMFKYETGKLHDIANQQVTLQTMRRLIQEGQIVHYETFLAHENADNEFCYFKQQLDHANSKISQILTNFPEDKKEKMRCLLHLKQAISSHIAEETVLHDKHLLFKMEQKEKHNAILLMENKYSLIEKFDETVLLKQDIIKKIIQNNGSGKSRIKNHQYELIKATQQKILMMKNEFEQYLNKFQDLQKQELMLFLKMAMKNLQFSTRSRFNSTLRLSPQFKQPGEDLLKSIMKLYKVAEYSSPDFTLDYILQSTKKALHPAEMVFLNDLFKDFDDMITKLRMHQRNSPTITSLNNSQRKGRVITEDCFAFENAVYTWWDQPAQKLVPWVREDGFNLSYYISRFMEDVAKLQKSSQVVYPEKELYF